MISDHLPLWALGPWIMHICFCLVREQDDFHVHHLSFTRNDRFGILCFFGHPFQHRIARETHTQNGQSRSYLEYKRLEIFVTFWIMTKNVFCFSHNLGKGISFILQSPKEDGSNIAMVSFTKIFDQPTSTSYIIIITTIIVHGNNNNNNNNGKKVRSICSIQSPGGSHSIIIKWEESKIRSSFFRSSLEIHYFHTYVHSQTRTDQQGYTQVLRRAVVKTLDASGHCGTNKGLLTK